MTRLLLVVYASLLLLGCASCGYRQNSRTVTLTIHAVSAGGVDVTQQLVVHVVP